MIYWRKPSEWASKLYEWIDGSGQIDSVLTLYEIRDGEVTVGTGTILVCADACMHANMQLRMLRPPDMC